MPCSLWFHLGSNKLRWLLGCQTHRAEPDGVLDDSLHALNQATPSSLELLPVVLAASIVAYLQIGERASLLVCNRQLAYDPLCHHDLGPGGRFTLDTPLIIKYNGTFAVQDQPLRSLVLARPTHLDWLYQIDLADVQGGRRYRELLGSFDGLSRLQLMFDLSTVDANAAAIELQFWVQWIQEHPQLLVGITFLVGTETASGVQETNTEIEYVIGLATQLISYVRRRFAPLSGSAQSLVTSSRRRNQLHDTRFMTNALRLRSLHSLQLPRTAMTLTMLLVTITMPQLTEFACGAIIESRSLPCNEEFINLDYLELLASAVSCNICRLSMGSIVPAILRAIFAPNRHNITVLCLDNRLGCTLGATPWWLQTVCRLPNLTDLAITHAQLYAQSLDSLLRPQSVSYLHCCSTRLCFTLLVFNFLNRCRLMTVTVKMWLIASPICVCWTSPTTLLRESGTEHYNSIKPRCERCD